MSLSDVVGTPSAVYEFAGFRLDVAERLLACEGHLLQITPKAFDLLVYLVEHPGRLLYKSTLLSEVWPGVVVEESNLAFQMSALRKAINGRHGEDLIQTVAGKGYRFVAPVTLNPRAEVPARALLTRARIVPGLVVSLLLLVCIVLLLSLGRRAPDPAPVTGEAVVTRLTATPTELPLDSASVSADGKMVAYAEPGGIRVQVIDTGDTRLLPATAGMHPFGWSASSTAIRAYACSDQTCDSWEVPLIANHPRRTGARFPLDEVAVLSPDGERLLRVTDWRVASVDSMNGNHPRLVMKSPSTVPFWGWSADSTRVLYTEEEAVVLNSVPLEGGASVSVFTCEEGQHIQEALELADRRLVLVMRRSAPTAVRSAAEYSIQEAHTDAAGVVRGLTRLLVPWRQEVILNLSASASGTRLVFRSGVAGTHVYVAPFSAVGGLIEAPKRLTVGDWEESVSAWTADGSHVLLSSSRYDESDTFVQDVETRESQPLVTRPGPQYRPQPTSDGRWLLYTEGQPGVDMRVQRAPLAGGRSETVARVSGFAFPHCSFRGRCILVEVREMGLVVYALDPERGKGDELGRWDEGLDGFCILPDGNAVALLRRGSSGRVDTIRVVSLIDHSARDVVIRGVTNLHSLDPTSDGTAFFSTVPGQAGGTLVLARLDGSAKVLWSRAGFDPQYAIGSRDGQSVAITVATWKSDVQMASGF